MKFIELTTVNIKSKVIVNFDLVTEVYDYKKEGSRLCFMGGQITYVEESYREIKNKLGVF